MRATSLRRPLMKLSKAMTSWSGGATLSGAGFSLAVSATGLLAGSFGLLSLGLLTTATVGGGGGATTGLLGSLGPSFCGVAAMGALVGAAVGGGGAGGFCAIAPPHFAAALCSSA